MVGRPPKSLYAFLIRVRIVNESGDFLCTVLADVAPADDPWQACLEHLSARLVDLPHYRQAQAAEELLDNVTCRTNPVEC